MIYTHWTKLGTRATLTFSKALRLSGLGIAVGAIAALVEHLELFGAESEEAKEMLDNLNKAVGDGTGGVKDDIAVRRQHHEQKKP